MHDTFDVVDGVRHCNSVEEVELVVRGHYELMAGSLRVRPKRAAKDAGSTRDQQSHLDTLGQILPV